ncbi:MAG: hypothetical protein NW223_23595 [Hyphomicrobiaceae bacterium]|nr:hypothetical protein [Hyphomicrobiaceae bacterium]
MSRIPTFSARLARASRAARLAGGQWQAAHDTWARHRTEQSLISLRAAEAEWAAATERLQRLKSAADWWQAALGTGNASLDGDQTTVSAMDLALATAVDLGDPCAVADLVEASGGLNGPQCRSLAGYFRGHTAERRGRPQGVAKTARIKEALSAYHARRQSGEARADALRAVAASAAISESDLAGAVRRGGPRKK